MSSFQIQPEYKKFNSGDRVLYCPSPKHGKKYRVTIVGVSYVGDRVDGYVIRGKNIYKTNVHIQELSILISK